MALFFILLTIAALCGIIWLNLWYRKKLRAMTYEELKAHEEYLKREGQMWL